MHCATSRRKVDRLLRNFATVYARCNYGPPGDVRTEVTALQHSPPLEKDAKFPSSPSLSFSLSLFLLLSFPRCMARRSCGAAELLRSHPRVHPRSLRNYGAPPTFPQQPRCPLTYSNEFARRTSPQYFSKMADGHPFGLDWLGINGREWARLQTERCALTKGRARPSFIRVKLHFAPAVVNKSPIVNSHRRPLPNGSFIFARGA